MNSEGEDFLYRVQFTVPAYLVRNVDMNFMKYEIEVLKDTLDLKKNH